MADRLENVSPQRQRLGQELRALRTLAKLSRSALGAALGVGRSTIQRAEDGTGRLGREHVRMWLDATNASEDVARRVIAMTEAVHGGGTWSDTLAAEAVPHLQAVAARRDEDADLIRSWTPGMIPALAQVDVYACALLTLMDTFGETDVPAATAARMQRQRILYEPGRRFEFLVGEQALYREFVPGVMVPQLVRLEAVAALELVEVAILPMRAAAPPWDGFVYREPADGGPPYVTVELPDSGPVRSEEAAVERFVAAWEQMWAAAVHGDDALALIREATK